MTTWVSDDTWNSLDPTTGRLDRSGRRALFGGIVGVAAVLALIALGFVSGVLAPRLSVHYPGGHSDAHRHSYDLTALVRNDGWFAERIVSVTSSKPGVRLRVASVRPSSVPAGGSARLVVHVTVTDCDEATGDDSSADSAVLEVDRPWGTASTRSGGSYVVNDALLADSLIQSACGRH